MERKVMSFEEAKEAVKSLKVGQKVKLFDKLIGGYSVVVPSMHKYKGMDTVITAISDASVSLACDCGMHCWSPDMFDLVVEEKVKEKVTLSTPFKHITREEAKEILSTLHVGQKVRIKDHLHTCLSGLSPAMEEYFGREAKITKLGHEIDSEQSVYLDVDNELFYWSVDTFDVIDDVPVVTEVETVAEAIAEDTTEEVTSEKTLTEGEKTMKNVTFNGKQIKRVLFNGNATIVFFSDGSKAVTKRLEKDTDDKEKALAMALVKSVYGKNFYKDIFEAFIPEMTEIKPVDDRPIQVGDKVRIKSWNDMVSQYGTDKDGDITFGGGRYFFHSKKKYCGEVITVCEIDDFDGELYYDEEAEFGATVHSEAVERI